ncbi:MAG TPA: hypothetical protein VFX17_03665 [Patescibacteria group bacterium]|nr:hypothetical protein [Patescibacteria group bacterium]
MDTNIPKKFKQKYLSGIIDKIRFWFFIRRVYWQKRMAVWEGNLDRIYFESAMWREITYNDTQDRKDLQKLKGVEYAEQDHEQIAAIEERIAHAKAVKESYRRNQEFIADTEKYISIIDLWFQN